MDARNTTHRAVGRITATAMSLLLILQSSTLNAMASDALTSSRDSCRHMAVQDVTSSGPKQRAARITLQKHSLSFDVPLSDADIQCARLFEEPLIPLDTPAITGENDGLRRALASFQNAGDLENAPAALISFISAFPNSRWVASCELNIGLLRVKSGRLSDGLSFLRSSWLHSKAQSGERQQLIAQRAISELLGLYARLGMQDELSDGLAELADRQMLGSNAARVAIARDSLLAMERSPKLQRCGPHALNMLLDPNNEHKVMDPRVKGFVANSKGTNLSQLANWSDELGLDLQMAKREPGAPMLTPSLMHWSVPHFAAVTHEDHGRYRVQDPTFEPMGNVWMSMNAIDSESDGYFLVRSGPLPKGWRSVSAEEAANVWGKGLSQNRDESKAPTQPVICLAGAGGGRGRGMAQASCFAMQAEATITDTPLIYSCPLGPEMAFAATFNQNEQGQPSSPNFTNLGPNWSLSWVSWLTVDGSKNATVHVRGGGIETYKYITPSNVTNPYPPALTSQAILSTASSGVFQRQLSDGSIEVFSLTDGAGNYFLTQLIDPQGNSAAINYDLATFRTNSVTDANGGVSTFSYLSNTDTDPDYYKLSGITDPFGRTAAFGWDSNETFLQSITDQIGIVSQFAYDQTTGFCNSLKTPYGTTTFSQYTPNGGTYPPRGLRFHFADGSSSVVESWLDHERNTYYWDREASASYPNDPVNHNYSRCHTTRWLVDASNLNLAPVAGWSKPPLESQTNFSYPGQGNITFVTGTNTPSIITKDLSGNATQIGTVGGAVTADDVIYLKVLNPSLAGGEISVQYLVQASDTSASIAVGLATAVNGASALQAIGVIASATGNQVRISATSAPTSYFATLSVGATETVDFVPEPAGPDTATVGGTVTAGDSVGLKVSNSSLPGGEFTSLYTVRSGDNLNAVAAGIASTLNAEPALQTIGLAASSSGTVVSVQSFSANLSAYSASLSGGATESITTGNATRVQKWQYEYNNLGYMTRSVDPIGRTFSYKYAGNDIDLLEIRETQGTDNFMLGKWQYNNQHLATLAIDGSGQRSSFVYDANGLPTSITNAIGGVSTFAYNSDLTATIGGTVSNGKIASITAFDPALSGGQQAVSYTATGSDTTTTVATNLKNNINANTNLQAIGVSATSAGSVITVKSVSLNTTTYTGSATNPMTMAVLAGPKGFLTAARGPLQQQDITRFVWNANGTMASVTSPEGYQLFFSYDNADRITQTSYPDGTSERLKYFNLDAVQFVDRLGRTSQQAFDSLGQLLSRVDPLGRRTQYSWCACGSLSSLTDAANHTTQWQHDLQGRVIKKVYADSTDIDYEYESNTSRLKRRTDALNQKANYSYNVDDTVSSISYTDAVNPTSTVTYQYDAKFDRTTRVENGWGRYDYSFNDLIADPFVSPTTGGGRLASVSNNVIPNSTITYSFDALGRTTNRSINGSSNSINWTYDAMSRVTQESNALGNFAFTYVDNVSPNSKGLTRLASIGYPNSQTTRFTWYENARDLRLREIQNLDPSSQVLSQFNYAYDPSGQVTRWLQQQKNSHVSFTLDYDVAGQLTGATSGRGTLAPPFANQYFYNYDSAANRTAVQTSQVQNVLIGGTKTTSDVITVNIFDSALSGGTVAVPYTVLSGDTLNSIATNLAATVTATASLQSAGIDAVASGTTITLRSKSPNLTTYTTGLSGGATETATVGINIAMHNATVGGTVTTSDQVKITVFDPALSGGQTTVTYTVAGGDSLTAIATGLKNAINGSAGLSAAGVSAASQGPVVTIQSLSQNVTGYAKPASPTTTETISFGPSLNGTVSALVSLLSGESITTGDILSISVSDPGLGGGSVTVTETVDGGETLANLASNLSTTINANTSLQGIGVSALVSGARLTLISVSTNATSYAAKVTNSGGSALGKEAILLGLPANGTTSATIAGSVSSGDQFTLTVYDSALSGGSVAKVVTSQTTANGVATALASTVNGDSNLMNAGITASAAIPTSSVSVVNVSSTSNNATSYTFARTGSATIGLSKNIGVSQATFNSVNELTAVSAGGAVRFQGTIDRPVLPSMTVDGGAVTMKDSRGFTANPILSSGSESVAISATAGGGSGTTTNNYKFEGIGSGSQTLAFDSNGNMTSDGTNSFLWDAENRLVQITYPGSGNNSKLFYDPLGQCVKIEEWTASTLTSTKQFTGDEERDATGAVTKQYFAQGQIIGTTPYFHSIDHLNSLREVTDASGTVQGAKTYDTYGQEVTLVSSVSSDIGFAGMYKHVRSGLNLASYRAYSPPIGRWLNRDPIMEAGGGNLYTYVAGNPVSFVDPLGLRYSTPDDQTEGANAMGDEEFLLLFPMGRVIGPIAGAAKGLRGAFISIGTISGGRGASTLGVASRSAGRISSGIGSACKTVLPRGRSGEIKLLDLLRGGTPRAFIRTPLTRKARFIDVLDNYRIAHESKEGYTSLTKFIREQIAKDVELRANGSVDDVVWHFYRSPATGQVGLSQPLFEELARNGIGIIIHPY